METPSGVLYGQAAKILTDIEMGLGAVHDIEGMSCQLANAIRLIKGEVQAYQEYLAKRA